MLYRLFTTLIVTLLLLITSNVEASKRSIVEPHESNLIAICKAIKNNSILRMNKSVRSVGSNLREVSDKLVCNGMTPFEFAVNHNADKTAERLAKRSKNKDELLAKLTSIRLSRSTGSAD